MPRSINAVRQKTRGVCRSPSFRLRYIFSSHASTKHRTGRLSRTRERDGRSGRRNSLFCANTSREAHAESHTNINHTYTAGLTKLFRRKRRMRRAAASACRLSRLRAGTAFDEEALRNAISPWTGVPMLSNKTASSDATFQKWRFPHLRSPRRVSFSRSEYGPDLLIFGGATSRLLLRIRRSHLTREPRFFFSSILRQGEPFEYRSVQRNTPFLRNERYYFQELSAFTERFFQGN